MSARPSPIRHFLSLADLTSEMLTAILKDAREVKAQRIARGLTKGAQDAGRPLEGRVAALVFEQPSTRTRVSFDIAMRQLGGASLTLNKAELQLGRSETVGDTIRVLSSYVDLIMIRTDSHEKLLEASRYAQVPLINGLTPISHPCQIMADLMTVLEAKENLEGLTISWVGDVNNVARSWIEAAIRFPMKLRLATPTGYPPPMEVVSDARAQGAIIDLYQDPLAAATGADVLVTDTWVSMTHTDKEARMKAFRSFQVNETLMKVAKPEAIFLHCLPAHRGDEVTDGVLDGPQSLAWIEAENRLHVQKSILKWCAGRLG